MHGKSEQEREAERDRERLRRAAKGVERLFQNIRGKLEACIHEMAEKYQLQPPQARRNFKRESYESEVERMLNESEGIVNVINEWLS